MKCLESEQREDSFFIVCELVRGMELLKVLEEHGAMQEVLAKAVIHKILQGVAHMHKNKFIHRDLKLENIFVKFSGNEIKIENLDEIKIVDLGFGKKIWNETTGFMGTPNYMPPEVFDNQP